MDDESNATTDDLAVPKSKSSRGARAPDPPPTLPSADGLATPIDHARATGNVTRRAVDPRRTFVVSLGGSRVPSETLSWQHRTAETLHGWRDHEYHAGAPIRITRQAYLAALDAITAPDKLGIYTPHAAALSPHAPIAKQQG
jgi:hypothetical protein